MDEFEKDLERLNTLMKSKWESITAQKEHKDEFGVKINEYDRYFRRQIGCGWGDVHKLSESSMKSFLSVLFIGNFTLQDVTDDLIKKQKEKMRIETEKINKVMEEYILGGVENGKE